MEKAGRVNVLRKNCKAQIEASQFFSNRGQFLIETVLMMIVLLGLFFWATNQLKQSEIMSSLLEEPWQEVSGMIESGVWMKAKQARTNHPNQKERGLSYDPNNPN